MLSFADYNPISVAVYFVAVSIMVMLNINPVILILSFFGAIIFYIIRNGRKNGKTHLYSLLLFTLLAIINPLVSHNGVTVLFVMNNNPVTLEALIYGVCASAMIVSVLYWFRSFSQIMTSDRLLYIFGGLSPKLALMLSMSLRFVPLFGRQAKKIRQTQKAMGLYKDDNIVDSFRANMRVFSILITWALENGIITADSMTARGYGMGKRTNFSNYRFRKADVFLMIICLVLCGLALFGVAEAQFIFYPSIIVPKITLRVVVGYISYGLLVLVPIIIEAKEALKWKYLKSKI